MRKTVRLPARNRVHLQPGILFTFAPERFSRSPRNRFHLVPESAKWDIVKDMNPKEDSKEPLENQPLDWSDEDREIDGRKPDLGEIDEDPSEL